MTVSIEPAAPDVNPPRHVFLASKPKAQIDTWDQFQFHDARGWRAVLELCHYGWRPIRKGDTLLLVRHDCTHDYWGVA